MKKKLVTLFAFVTTALVLVACGGVSVEPGPPPPPIEVTASPTGPHALADFTGSRDIHLTIPASFNNDPDVDLVVIEAYSENGNVSQIYVRNTVGSLVAASDTPYGFVPAAYLQSFAVDGISTQQVTAECLGPCVILPATGSTEHYIVEVVASGKTEFFAYDAGFGDEGEPTNDNPQGARTLTAGNPLIGSFETLWDEDYFYAPSTGTLKVEFIGEWENFEDIEIVVEIMKPNKVDVDTTVSGHVVTVPIIADETFRISTEEGVAGTHTSSMYRITLQQ